MRNGLLAVALLCLVGGCDLQSLMRPPTRTAARSIPAQTPPEFAPPSVENQLSDVESQLKDKPDDINLLKTKAILLQTTAQKKIQLRDVTGGYADYQESGLIWRKIKAESRELNPQDSSSYATAIYNLACALSLKNEVEPAIAALKDSIENGFARRDLLKNDVDLNNIRGHADFNEMAKLIEKHQIESVKKQVASDQLFPFEFSLTNLQGETVSARDFNGKVLIVDIWGTWCPPCRREIPLFVALHQKYKDKAFDIVGINYEHTESPDEAKKLIVNFAAQNNISYNCVIGDEKTRNQIPAFEGYPTTLFIDKQGRVRAKFSGEQPYEVLEVAAQVLLDETPTAPVQ